LKDLAIKVETEKVSDQREIGESWARRHISELVQLDHLVRHERHQYDKKYISKAEIFRDGSHLCQHRKRAVKPGSHMPPTYLGHRYGIRVHLLPNHNLSQALTAGLPAKLSRVQLHRQAGSCRRLSAMKIFYVNIICGRNIL